MGIRKSKKGYEKYKKWGLQPCNFFKTDVYNYRVGYKRLSKTRYDNIKRLDLGKFFILF